MERHTHMTNSLLDALFRALDPADASLAHAAAQRLLDAPK